jgi:hypothetical protein
VPALTDLFNEAIDDVTATLTAVVGLRVVNDATKIVPNCVFIDAPSWQTQAGNGKVIEMTFPIKVIGSGPAGLPVLRQILSICAKVQTSAIIVMSGDPGSVEIGGATYPAYNMTMSLKAQA